MTQDKKTDPKYPKQIEAVFEGEEPTPTTTRPKRRPAPSALNKAGKRLRENGKSVYETAGDGLEKAESKADTAARGRDLVQDGIAA